MKIISLSIVLLFLQKLTFCAHWGAFQDDGCKGDCMRQKSSILWGISGSWETACQNQPATVDNIYFDRPTRCVNTGVNMWGEFRIRDQKCCPHWGAFQDDGCRGVFIRQKSSILWGISGSWETACQNQPATVDNIYFERPTRCVNVGLYMRGEFEIRDYECFTPTSTITITTPRFIYSTRIVNSTSILSTITKPITTTSRFINSTPPITTTISSIITTLTSTTKTTSPITSTASIGKFSF